tara:strand:- start:746 stop:1018 length:273 start_codon:yes stop_codon:yes gene_type:complete
MRGRQQRKTGLAALLAIAAASGVSVQQGIENATRKSSNRVWRPIASKAEGYNFNAQGVATRIYRVGRNEPCPCGCGKKFKQCTLIEEEKC